MLRHRALARLPDWVSQATSRMCVSSLSSSAASIPSSARRLSVAAGSVAGRAIVRSIATCGSPAPPLPVRCLSPLLRSLHVSGPAAAAEAAEEFEFQTDTRRVLDIVTHSLYTDREVFLRELVSNASDALEKARHVALTESTGVDAGHPLEIRIEADEANGTVTITDSGIGMTKEDLVSHLGTIARSGTKAFLQTLAAKPDAAADGSGIIGKFGVGFYAAFMVADRVEVHTRSALPDSVGYRWESTGDGRFSITEEPDAARGCKIVLHLKDDAKEFAADAKLKEIVKKYSNFVAHPILLGEERLNTVQALWMRSPKEVTDEEHAEFFKFAAGGFGDAQYRLHFVADAPLSIKALFYVPMFNTEKFGFANREEARVALYSRKVLIMQRTNTLLPEYLRFVTGVVDCEDIPLNISRETMQDSALLRKLRDVLTGRVIKLLLAKAKEDPAQYDKFFTEFGMNIKEGICLTRSESDKSRLAPLLRFESSAVETSSEADSSAVSLDDYVERCPEGQDCIYFICAPTRDMAMASAYMEAFKKSNTEVLMLYGSADEFVMTHLGEYKGKKLVNVESENVKLPEAQEKGSDGDSADADAADKPAALSKDDAAELSAWIKKVLDAKVHEVKVSTRLVDSPAMLVGHQTSAVRKMQQLQLQMAAGHKDAKGMGFDVEGVGPVGSLEINPAHPILKQLHVASRRDGARTRELAEAVVWQVFDNAKIAAGVLDDPRTMLHRLNTILAAAVPTTDEGGASEDPS